jgi:hypothetical protein
VGGSGKVRLFGERSRPVVKRIAGKNGVQGWGCARRPDFACRRRAGLGEATASPGGKPWHGGVISMSDGQGHQFSVLISPPPMSIPRRPPRVHL